MAAVTGVSGSLDAAEGEMQANPSRPDHVGAAAAEPAVAAGR